MSREELLELFDRRMRIELEIPEARRETVPGPDGRPEVVRFVRGEGGTNEILYSAFDSERCEEVVGQQLDYFARLGGPVTWKVYGHDRPEDLLERLGDYGFERREREAVMILDLAEAPAELLTHSGAEVRRIEGREGLEDVADILSKVWGRDFSWVRERMADHLERPGFLTVYTVCHFGSPACVGWMYYHGEEFGSLWGGSTLAEHRGRGLYWALLSARVQDARKRGLRYLTVDAGPMSRPILERGGFRELSWACDCVLHGEGEQGASAEA